MFYVLNMDNDHIQLEQQLKVLNFSIVNINDCICENKIYYLYHQQCSCCYDFDHITQFNQELNKKKQDVISNDLVWYQNIGCKICIMSLISSLHCGGHYNNYRIFKIKNGIETNYSNKLNLLQYDLNPNDKVYEDDE